MGECVRRARESGAKALTLHTTDMMQAAMRLYERLGFQRMRELDFEAAPGVTVKGFRLSLSAVSPRSHRTPHVALRRAPRDLARAVEVVAPLVAQDPDG